jgi:hypothetical protein
MICGTVPLERALFALAGTVTLLTVALAAFASPWFLLVAVFVGLNQLLFVVSGDCGASLVLKRLPCPSREVDG